MKSKTFFLIACCSLIFSACNNDKNGKEDDQQAAAVKEQAPVENSQPAKQDSPALNDSRSAVKVDSAEKKPEKAVLARSKRDKTVLEVNDAYTYGNFLTVEMTDASVNGSSGSIIPIKDIAIIDEQNNRKYTVIKDNEGEFMAGTKVNSEALEMARATTGSQDIWVQFPAIQAKTITLIFPDCSQPITGIPVRVKQ